MIFINYIFIDFEMNEIDDLNVKTRCANEIIQIGAVKLNNNLKEIDNFSIYIKPQYNQIVPRIADITGITNEKVSNSCKFSEALDKFLEWVGEDFLILAWSSNDYKQLKDESILKEYSNEKLTYMFKHWADFQREFCDLLGLKKNKRISLDLALELVGTSFKGKRHDALSDSRNTIYLYRISRNKSKFKEEMIKVKEVLFQKETKTTIGDILGEQLNIIKESIQKEVID